MSDQTTNESTSPSATGSPSSDTPETDSETRHSWCWDTHKMDYRPAGIVVDVDFARKMERERDEARQIARDLWDMAAACALMEDTNTRELLDSMPAWIHSENVEHIHGGVRETKSEPASTPLDGASC